MSQAARKQRQAPPSSPPAEARTTAWEDGCRIAPRPPLRENQRADVVVVGAGIAGLTTAYLLARDGRNVVVIDDRQPGAGQTHRTTAHLSCAIDDRYFEIERIHGAAGARLAAASHQGAIDCIERIVHREGLDCDFERLDGYLFLGSGQPETVIGRELEAAHRAGLDQVERMPGLRIATLENTSALRFPQQAQVHALRYLSGLLNAAEALGVRVFSDARASSVKGDSRGATVQTAAGYRIDAGAAVVATNTPVNDVAVIHTKQAPYTTYVIAAPVPAGSVPHGLYWDTLDPYHYVRLQRLPDDRRHELLIVGGEDHKTGQANDREERHARLEAWARPLFSTMEEVRYRWSGQVMETVDGLAFIGRNPLAAGNIFIATGDSGMGMTYGTIAGMLLSDLIQNRPNPWADLYDPSRKPLAALRDFADENLNVARQYLDWVLPGSPPPLEQLPRGCGAVVQQGLNKHAVYRDAEGRLHAFSAVCPHLKCIVQWNGVERIWECPCHGSRFNALGRMLSGPAAHDLAPAAGGTQG